MINFIIKIHQLNCILLFNPISYTDNNEESAFENTDWIANLEKFEELAYTRVWLVLVTPFLFFTFDDELKQTWAKDNVKVNIRHNFMPLCVILHGWWYLSSCMKMQQSRRLLTTCTKQISSIHVLQQHDPVNQTDTRPRNSN